MCVFMVSVCLTVRCLGFALDGAFSNFFHTSWLAVPPRPVAPSPPARKGLRGEPSAVERTQTWAGWRLQAVNLYGNETKCTHAHTRRPFALSQLCYCHCREQSALCLAVVQLDTAVESGCSSGSGAEDRTELCGPTRGHYCCCTTCVPHSSHSIRGENH